MKIFEQELIRKMDTEKGVEIVAPNPVYLDNIRTLYTILNLIWEEWESLLLKYREEVKDKEENEVNMIFMEYFALNQTRYLKCLFSYIYFFWALVNVYEQVLASLNKFNRKNNLNVKQSRMPIRDEFIQKTRYIRDLSITHIGSGKVGPIDSLAAYLWSPLTASFMANEAPDLEDMEFGSGKLGSIDITGNRIEQSIDFHIKGLFELKEKCLQYLKNYDTACVRYHVLLKTAVSSECGK